MEKFVKGEKKEWAGLRQSLVKLCEIRKAQIKKEEKSMKDEKEMEKFEDDKKLFRKFCEMAMATDYLEEQEEMTVAIPAKIVMLAKMSRMLNGLTLDQIITDALTDYLTNEN